MTSTFDFWLWKLYSNVHLHDERLCQVSSRSLHCTEIYRVNGQRMDNPKAQGSLPTIVGGGLKTKHGFQLDPVMFPVQKNLKNLSNLCAQEKQSDYRTQLFTQTP